MEKFRRWYADDIKLYCPTSLYIHIPFCSRMCHYCDFVKTARHDANAFQNYWQMLEDEFLRWTKLFKDETQGFQTIYFGGGTPSLFSVEIQNFLKQIEKYILDTTEITLEINPEDVTEEKCLIWKKSGVNRVSLGVQSFQKEGLKFLTRLHLVQQIEQAILTLQRHFNYPNLDLIFGWQDQSLAMWEDDLKKMLSYSPNHISLYQLTYADKTPIGRKFQRGVIQVEQEDDEKKYSCAQKILAAEGYEHYEISNWTREGRYSRHNLNYWLMGTYLGLGPGAHGYLATDELQGMRYSYPANFSKQIEIDQRTLDHFFEEMVITGLRTKKGITVSSLEKKFFKKFLPNQVLQRGLNEKKLILREDILTIDINEWFRESAWCCEVVDSFKTN